MERGRGAGAGRSRVFLCSLHHRPPYPTYHLFNCCVLVFIFVSLPAAIQSVDMQRSGDILRVFKFKMSGVLVLVDYCFCVLCFVKFCVCVFFWRVWGLCLCLCLCLVFVF